MNNDTQLEALWLQRLQQNDEQALAAIMRKYYTALYNYGARFTNDEALVKDCIQEVFISLWQRRESAAEILSPRYYLLRAVKNKVLKSLHQHVIRIGSMENESAYDFLQEFSVEKLIIDKQMSEEQATILRKTMAQLSKRQHELIYLKFYQHLDHAQIAGLMNLSRQSVYNLLHETIQKLRSLWQAEMFNQ
ncbi:RNA polymerase, sigma-24 subunit, ECF subfamily [Niastella koreensis GR20-10]|uniref:RNA polymerase, sigma-24 subunit, ECF subfamily n=2 Tax=Niastella koreensis TaxID=354356 RepID=G8TKE6_NIAKG|nr:sigma-70 family RNA polymerase sigma factor [Niastella koreensis]AEV97602.1 RNA polymerase, sigma-24 subunit, ECF subfamily [Niastella koreensis GR20-10]